MDPAPAPVPPPPRPRPSWVGSLAAVLGPGLALFLLLCGSLWWMATTAPGLRLAAALVNAVVPGITLNGVDGSLTGGLRAASFVYASESWSLRIEDLVIEPRAWKLWDRRIDAERVSARRVHIEWVSSGGPGTVPCIAGSAVRSRRAPGQHPGTRARCARRACAGFSTHRPGGNDGTDGYRCRPHRRRSRPHPHRCARKHRRPAAVSDAGPGTA